MADEKKKLTVAEMLAAARKADAGGKSDAPKSDAPKSGATNSGATNDEPSQAATEQPPPKKQPAEKPPAKKPASATGAAAPGGRLSVAEMLAAARAGKSSEAAEQPVAAEAAQKPAAAKASPKSSPDAATASAPVSTAGAHPGGPSVKSSILGGEGEHRKRGPMSKGEAGPLARTPAKASPSAASPDRVTPKAAAKAAVVVPPMPAKPDYAKKAKQEAAVEPDRRGFVASLGLAVGTFLGAGFTSLAGTLGLWTLGTVRFMFPNVLTEPPSRFKVGYPSEFAPGYVENKFKNDFGVWVVNSEYNGTSQIFALSTVCTHLGCTPNWLDAEQKFKCPCHGSGFYKDGINFEGPAPRPLERYAIRLADDGQLEVDKSMKFFEEKGEWANPDSFVTV